MEAAAPKNKPRSARGASLGQAREGPDPGEVWDQGQLAPTNLIGIKERHPALAPKAPAGDNTVAVRNFFRTIHPVSFDIAESAVGDCRGNDTCQLKTARRVLAGVVADFRDRA
jgi:hypothetical protein